MPSNGFFAIVRELRESISVLACALNIIILVAIALFKPFVANWVFTTILAVELGLYLLLPASLLWLGYVLIHTLKKKL